MDEVVTVTDDEISTAILALIEQQKMIAEGAGAVSIAAVMFGKVPVEGKMSSASSPGEYRCNHPVPRYQPRASQIWPVGGYDHRAGG
ncbi:MAG: hypothetical protein ACLR23_11040 [Clostridia bacterium]